MSMFYVHCLSNGNNCCIYTYFRHVHIMFMEVTGGWQDVQHNFNCLNSFVYVVLFLQNKIVFHTCHITVY